MSNRPGYKHTPLGWIPDEWEISELGEILTLKRGYDLTNKQRKPGKVPVFTSGGLNGYHDTAMVKAPGVVTGRYGTVGEVYYCEIDYWPHNTTLYVSEFKSVEVVYAYHLLRSINFKKYSDKSAVQGINRNHLHNEVLAIPNNSKEQRIIAAILSTWDEAISKTHQLIEQLKYRNDNIFQKLLTGRKRLRGFNESWKEISLSDAFKERNEIGYDYLTLLSIGSIGVYPQSQSEKRDTSNSNKAKYKRICPGDIGYNTMRMWQGRSALSSLEGIVSPAYTIVTPKENQHPQFFAYLFKLPAVINKFFRNSQGLVEDTLNCKFKDFAKVKVVVPEYEEQVAIAEVLSKAVEEVFLYEKKLAALQQQKKGLMQKLLTGEVRVKI